MVTSSLPQESLEFLHDWSMADYEDCEEDVTMQLIWARTSKDQDIDASKCTIDIVLWYKGIGRELPHDSDHGRNDSSNDVLLFEYVSYLTIDARKLDDIPSQHEEVKKEMSGCLHLFEDFANGLLDYIIECASREYAALQDGHNFLRLEFDVSLIHSHYPVLLEGSFLGEEEEDEEEEIYYVAPCMMVPATNDSIRSLKREKVHQDSDQNCVICLEELSEDYDAVLMPCSHPFHEDCIENWLNTSHYCPVCRFKMPRGSN